MTQKATTVYSSSLAKLSRSDAEFSEWVGKLKGLKEIIDSNPTVKALLSSPIIKTDNKMEVLKKVLNGDSNSIISQFLFVLLEKRRWILFDGIVKQLNEEIKKRSSVMELDIFVKEPLTADVKEKVTKLFENKYKKKVFLKEKLDPDLIGGAILLSDNTMVDCSILGRLDQMKIDLKGKV